MYCLMNSSLGEIKLIINNFSASFFKVRICAFDFQTNPLDKKKYHEHKHVMQALTTQMYYYPCSIFLHTHPEDI